MYKEVKAMLTKSQTEIKKYVDRNRKEMVEYKVGDKVLLSTEDLMWQMEKFIGPYKIKKIISENMMELELPVLMKIHLMVNVSRIVLHQKQIEGQKKIPPPVEIDGEKKYEVKKILNRRDVRGKLKYLFRWKEYTVKEDTWERLENLGDIIDLVENFEKEIREKEIKRVQTRKEKGKERALNPEAEVFRSEILRKYIVKILFG